jgi:hypothetical protein
LLDALRVVLFLVAAASAVRLVLLPFFLPLVLLLDFVAGAISSSGVVFLKRRVKWNLEKVRPPGSNG